MDVARSVHGAANAPKGSGSSVVHRLISHKIFTLEFPPGMLLEEPKLVQLLGVSRTLVREALIRLRTEGLVVQTSNHTAAVAPIDIPTLRHYFEAVDVADRTVSRWAASRRSDAHLLNIHGAMLAFEQAVVSRDGTDMIERNRDFHVTVASAAGNVYFLDLCTRLFNQGLRVGRMTLAYEIDHSNLAHFERLIADHRALYEAIAEGDPDRAEIISGNHSKLGRERTFSNLSMAS